MKSRVDKPYYDVARIRPRSISCHSSPIARLLLLLVLVLSACLVVIAQDTASVVDKQSTKQNQQQSIKPASPDPSPDASPSPTKKDDDKTKKPKRGSLVIAPIPISSPAFGSGLILVAGY